VIEGRDRHTAVNTARETESLDAEWIRSYESSLAHVQTWGT